MKNDFRFVIINAISRFVWGATGGDIPCDRFKNARDEGELALSMVREGDLTECVNLLNARLFECRLDGLPVLCKVSARNGWLIFHLSNAMFDLMIRGTRELEYHGRVLCDDGDNYLQLLSRKPPCACPDVAAVRRALWLSWCAYSGGKWTNETELAMRSMTTGLYGKERLDAEAQIGGAANAILKLRRCTKCG